MDEKLNQGPASSRAQLVRESATGSFGSFLALAAGLLLDLTLAFLLGAGSETDALFVALRVPLGIAVFFPPTAIQVLVPLISRWLEQENKRATDLRTSGVVVAVSLISGGVALGGILMAPLLTSLLAPGLPADTQRLAADLARIVFLIVPPIAVSEVLRAYRHAHRAHGLASGLQGILGLTIILILVASSGGVSVVIAAWAWVAGAFAQLVAGWLLARSSGFTFVPGPAFSKEVREVGALAIRPLGGSAIQLATRLVEQIVASFLAPGSITILTYANRLVGAAGGTLLFRPIMTAVLGPMSVSSSDGDTERTRQLFRDGLRIMLMVSAALTVVVVVAGPPFVTGLFSLGSFQVEEAQLLGITVAVYAASLPGAALQRMLLGVSFARLDTKVYLRNTTYGAAVNLALLAVMVIGWRSLDLLMVPIAYSLAQVVNVWHAGQIVRGQLDRPFAGSRDIVVKVMIVALSAAIIMGAIRFWLAPDLSASAPILILVGLVTATAGAISLAAGWLLAGGEETAGLRTRLGISR